MGRFRRASSGPPSPAAAALIDPPRRRRWLRTAVHTLGVIAGWCLFFWGWSRVFERGTDFAELRWLMLGAVLTVPALTLSWIAHNRGIYRRKGPRRAVPAAAEPEVHDFNGRRLQADWAALAGAQCVEIVIEGPEGDVKRFRRRGAP